MASVTFRLLMSTYYKFLFNRYLCFHSDSIAISIKTAFLINNCVINSGDSVYTFFNVKNFHSNYIFAKSKVN